MNINKVIFLVISIAIFLSCTQDNENVNLLMSENEKLNRAFKDKDWEIVYSLKLESEKYGIGLEYWSKKWDKNTFIQEQERRYALGKYEPEFYSYNLNGDTAEIKNLNTIVIVSDSSTKYIDTLYNYWVFKEKKWLLKAWNIHKYFSESLPGDSTVRALTDSLHNSLWKEYMD